MVASQAPDWLSKGMSGALRPPGRSTATPARCTSAPEHPDRVDRSAAADAGRTAMAGLYAGNRVASKAIYAPSRERRFITLGVYEARSGISLTPVRPWRSTLRCDSTGSMKVLALNRQLYSGKRVPERHLRHIPSGKPLPVPSVEGGLRWLCRTPAARK